MLMKRTFLPLFFVILFTTIIPVFAQPLKNAANNSLEKGSWSLQFQVSDNFNLKSFQGSNLSAKKHLSDKSALRFGVGLSAFSNNRDQQNEDFSYMESIGKTENEESLTQINVSGYFIYYPNPEKKMNVYFGGGPLVGYSNFDETSTSNEISQDTVLTETMYDNSVNSFSIGLSALIGVEWFVKKEISLHAEYRSSFVYKAEDRELTTNRTRLPDFDDKKRAESETSGYSFRSGGVMFGVSVYF